MPFSSEGPNVASEHWRSTSFHADVTEWVDDALGEAGLSRTGPLEQLRVRPWSTNIVVPVQAAPRGRVWFKACVTASAYEAGVVAALGRVHPTYVAPPIAVDRDRGWLLAYDQGAVLRDVVTAADLVPRWAAVLRRYAELQVALVGAALPGEVPASSPKDLVAAYVDRVPNAKPAVLQRLSYAAARLEQSRVPSSLQHDDLHTGNVFVGIDGAPPHFFDWGDAYLGHPFASMLIGLRCIPHQYDRVLSDAERDLLVDAYLESWAAYGDPGTLKELLDDALLLAPIGRALGWERSLSRASQAEREEWRSYAEPWLSQVGADS